MTIRDSATYDNLLLLKDAGAVTASGVGTVGGSPRVLDLGDARLSGKVLVDSSALDVASGDETYTVAVEGSNAIGFGSGVVTLGSASVSAAGRAEAHFSTRQGSTTYRYVRVRHTLGGTTPSLNYTAFIAKD